MSNEIRVVEQVKRLEKSILKGMSHDDIPFVMDPDG